MQTYISLLRGINVSGRKKILMKDLKMLFQSLDFENVQTYIQSGNVVFEAAEKENEQEMSFKIAEAILRKYGFEVPILVFKKEEWQKAVIENPFLREENVATKSLYVTFLAEKPKAENLAKLESVSFLPDIFTVSDKRIYLKVEKYGKTKLSNNFFERKLKVSATTRNWKTVLKLYDISTKNEI